MTQKSTSLEQLIMRHEQEIDDIKDNNHQRELNILEIKNDVKSVLEKLDAFKDTLDKQEARLKELEDDDSLENRIATLEGFHKKREQFVGMLYGFGNLIYKMRWPLFIIFLMSFAVDVDFRIQNPQIMKYVLDKLPPIFNK